MAKPFVGKDLAVSFCLMRCAGVKYCEKRKFENSRAPYRGGNTENAESGESGEREEKENAPGLRFSSGAFWVLRREVGGVLTNSTAVAGHRCESGEPEEREGGGFRDGVKLAAVRAECVRPVRYGLRVLTYCVDCGIPAILATSENIEPNRVTEIDSQ